MDVIFDLFRSYVFLIWLFAIWLLLFISEPELLEKYYEKSFIKSWSIIYIIITIFSYLGGQGDAVKAEFESDYIGGLFYLIGSALGAIIFSLVLTYLYVLIKIPLKRIHQITNKKDIKIENKVPSETELKEFLKYHRQSYAVVKNNWEYWEDVYKAWLKST